MEMNPGPHIVGEFPTRDRLERKVEFAKFKLDAATNRAEKRLKGIRRPFDRAWAKYANKRTALPSDMIPVSLSDIRQHAKGDCKDCAGQGVVKTEAGPSRKTCKYFTKPIFRELGVKSFQIDGYMPCACSFKAFVQINAVRLYREPARGRMFWTHKLS